MRLPHKTLERNLFNRGYKYIIAVDEVGIGPLAGPVTACAVLITRKFFAERNKNLHWLRDSKMLQPQKREEFAAKLRENKNIKFAVAYSQVSTIDKINVYQAARLAMARATLKLTHKSQLTNSKQIPNPKFQIPNTIILIDGKTKIGGLDIEQMPVIEGDRKVFSIACASIIAKVARDKMMTRYAKKYPHYGFEKHKGYGTKMHMACLAKHGPCEMHRKSFRPIKNL